MRNLGRALYAVMFILLTAFCGAFAVISWIFEVDYWARAMLTIVAAAAIAVTVYVITVVIKDR